MLERTVGWGMCLCGRGGRDGLSGLERGEGVEVDDDRLFF